MATDLFLTDTGEGFLGDSTNDLVLSLTRGDAAVSDTASSDNSNGTHTTTSASATEFINNAGNPIEWYSPRLTGVTISGTITVNLRGAESNMSANQEFCIRLSRVNGTTGAFISDIFNANNGAELAVTTETAVNWTPTVTSTTLSDGDRLRVHVATCQIGTGALGHTTTLWYDGPTASASGDSWLRFTETLTEFVAGGDSLIYSRRQRGRIIR